MMLAVSVERAAANNAPPALPSCIIRYTYSSASQSATRVVLYDASGVYTELSVTGTTLPATGLGSSGGSSTTSTPHRGLYVYIVDTKNSEHASIVYDGGGTGALPSDDLYFLTSSSGSRQPPASVSLTSDLFSMFAMQSSTGAINFSNRTALAASDPAITGFVIGGSKTNWVLVRAVGAGLASFGVSPTVSQPSFTIYDGKQAVAGVSAAWGADPNLVSGYKAISARIGAFPLSDTSDEGVLLIPLPPGEYTAVFKGKSAGQILCETYILPFSADNP